ncbi:hypothetical protein CDL15_Pgr027330 [Punica granatum]|uniref:Uncharacterized protein n=1 Tax=Punica granatum TaxID=22663 RepID=A0A218WBX1_PUNGR|nr:hypothetical protein CDL15_Pgr027330 [Punica granatum]
MGSSPCRPKWVFYMITVHIGKSSTSMFGNGDVETLAGSRRHFHRGTPQCIVGNEEEKDERCGDLRGANKHNLQFKTEWRGRSQPSARKRTNLQPSQGQR